MPKFKIPLQKDILHVGKFLVLLTGELSCHIQGLHSTVYALVIMQHGKVSCILIVNGDRHLVRELEDRLVPDQGEVSFWTINSLDLHEMILRDQESALEARHEETSDYQD